MKNTYILLLALFSFIAIQAQVDRTVMPTPGPAPEVNLGTPQSFKLNNGLKVLVVENGVITLLKDILIILVTEE